MVGSQQQTPAQNRPRVDSLPTVDDIKTPLTTTGRFVFFYLFLSVRFNGHFPGEPGLAGVYWSKGWWRWWWQLDYYYYYKSCKDPVKSSPPTKQHPVFYRPDALPVTQPTVSKHWGENITFHWLVYPKLTWGLPTFSLTTDSSWLPWGSVALPLISPLMPVPLSSLLIYRYLLWKSYSSTM